MDVRTLSLNPQDWIKNPSDQLWYDLGGYIDPTELYKICDFCAKCLVILDGENEGQPFTFHEWFLRDVLFPCYAMKNKDGTRRIGRGCVFCPKKVGKTTSLAAVCIAELCLFPRSEVYILSSALESAAAMFKAIRDFLNTSPVLAQRETGRKNLKLPWLRENIKVVQYQQSLLKVLSGDKTGKSGHNISFLACDEICEFTDMRAFERMSDGGKYRKNPICPLSITTPLYDRNSLAWEQYLKVSGIISGKVVDPSFLAVYHGLPPDVDWRDQENWWKYLAGLGDLVNKDQYRKEFERRKDSPREMIAFRNYFLCQWAESLESWLDMDRYKEQVKHINLDDLKGHRCFISVDGSFTSLASVVLFFPDDMVVYPFFWHPQATADKYDAKYHTHFKAWKEAGYLDYVAGDYFDWATVRSKITALSEQFSVIELAFDPQALEGRMTEIVGDFDFPVIPVPPYKGYVARPTKHLERLVFSKALTFHDNPVMEWNMANARVKVGAHDEITLDRNQVANIGQRYDSTAALVIALNRYLESIDNELVLDNGIMLF